MSFFQTDGIKKIKASSKTKFNMRSEPCIILFEKYPLTPYNEQFEYENIQNIRLQISLENFNQTCFQFYNLFFFGSSYQL